MAFVAVSSLPSKLQSILLLPPSQWKKPILSATALSSPSLPPGGSQKPSNGAPELYPTIHLKKRVFNLSIAAIILSMPVKTISGVLAEEDLVLERYIDPELGFTLLTPPSWIKVDKAGATVLFEEPNKGANNVGVVVNPVRLKDLREFGSPQFVADKLIQVEKRKESTKEAEVIAAIERSGSGGLPVYEIEYRVDSTRGGMKRFFSAVFVASKKLYVLNIAHFDKPESPLDPHRRRILEQVLHSFDSVPLA